MNFPPRPWSRAQVIQLYPELTADMSDEEIDDFVSDINEDEELKKPFFARALDSGNLPLWAVGIVVALSIVGMLIAAVVGP